jgi:putative phosphoesterase
MLIGVISDLHGNRPALEAVLADMKRRSVETIICCGDLLAFGPHPGEVLDVLLSLKSIRTIRGNTERWMEIVRAGRLPYEEKVITRIEGALAWTLEKLGARADDFLRTFPPALESHMGGLKIFARHAGLDSDTQGILPGADLRALATALEQAGCDILLCGHTHIPFTKKEGKTHFVNAGSVALPFDGIASPAWALLEMSDETLKTRIFRVDYDRTAAMNDLAKSGMPLAEIWIERIKNARM